MIYEFSLQFSYALGVIFICEVVGACLCFVFSSQVKAKVTDVLQSEAIPRYRDDPDFHDLMNWVQETVSISRLQLEI